jgi:hypothetical protein
MAGDTPTARIRGGVGQLRNGLWITQVEITDTHGKVTLYVSEARYETEDGAMAAYQKVRKPLLEAIDRSGVDHVQLAPPDGYVEVHSAKGDRDGR